MGAVYATVSDITAIGVTLTPQQSDSAEVLLSQASARLRTVAKKFGTSIDDRISADEDYGESVKSIVVQAVVRAINSISSNSPALSQGSETNGQYSVSMTFLNAGQSLYFLKSELKELGIMRQTYGAFDLYSTGG